MVYMWYRAIEAKMGTSHPGSGVQGREGWENQASSKEAIITNLFKLPFTSPISFWIITKWAKGNDEKNYDSSKAQDGELKKKVRFMHLLIH